MAHPTAAGCASEEKWIICLPACSTKSADAKARKEQRITYVVHRKGQKCVFYNSLILAEI